VVAPVLALRDPCLPVVGVVDTIANVDVANIHVGVIAPDPDIGASAGACPNVRPRAGIDPAPRGSATETPVKSRSRPGALPPAGPRRAARRAVGLWGSVRVAARGPPATGEKIGGCARGPPPPPAAPRALVTANASSLRRFVSPGPAGIRALDSAGTRPLK